MPKFRKKPVEIEAMQYDGYNTADVLFWIGSHHSGTGPRIAEVTEDGRFIIHTLEGDHLASHGDYVIRGVKGEFYPCKPDIFAATYDPA